MKRKRKADVKGCVAEAAFEAVMMVLDLLNVVGIAVGIALFALTFLHMGSAGAETVTCIVPKGQSVNVRTAPRTDAATKGRRLYSGEEVVVMDVDGGWIEIDWSGEKAYVKADYFEQLVGAAYRIEANGRVRWREGPGGEVGGFYQPGEVVVVDAMRYGPNDTKWARVGDRYIDAAFLTLSEEDGGTQ